MALKGGYKMRGNQDHDRAPEERDKMDILQDRQGKLKDVLESSITGIKWKNAEVNHNQMSTTARYHHVDPLTEDRSTIVVEIHNPSDCYIKVTKDLNTLDMIIDEHLDIWELPSIEEWASYITSQIERSLDALLYVEGLEDNE